MVSQMSKDCYTENPLSVRILNVLHSGLYDAFYISCFRFLVFIYILQFQCIYHNDNQVAPKIDILPNDVMT